MASNNIQEQQDESGGFDVEFVDETITDIITCSICLLILREPVQGVPCGHRFCRSCIDKYYKQSSQILTCPNDRQQLKVFPDVGKRREILDMIVKCKNTLCTWRGEIRQWENHIAECPWQLLECTSKCGKEIAKKMMDEHLLKECTAPLKCKYAVIGCTFQGQKDSLAEHLTKAIDEHLMLQIANQSMEIDLIKTKQNLLKTKLHAKERVISVMEARLANKDRQIDELNEKFERLSLPHCPFIWEFKNFRKEYVNSKKTNKNILSKPFFCLNGYKARLRLYLNGYDKGQDNHISVFLQIMRGPFDDSLEWPMPFDTIKFNLMINEEWIKEHDIKNNTQEKKKKFVRPNEENGIAFGALHYFSHDKVPSWIENDMVLFYVNVVRFNEFDSGGW